MVGEFDIAENMVLDSYYDEPYSHGFSMDWPAVHKVCVKNVIDFDVRTPSIYSLANHLSGGNQQKLIVARELSREVKLVIAAQPTRGIDVGSIEYIHKRIIEARDRGVGVLIVSTELDEIMALSDRILVMFRGRIAGSFKAGEVEPRRDRPGDGRRGSGGMSDYMRQETLSEQTLTRAAAAAFRFRDAGHRAGAGGGGGDGAGRHHDALDRRQLPDRSATPMRRCSPARSARFPRSPRRSRRQRR